jgi:hypothetical protein
VNFDAVLSARTQLQRSCLPDICRRGLLAGELGFEPRQAESESAVLPLDDSPIPTSGPGPAASRIAARTPGCKVMSILGRDVSLTRVRSLHGIDLPEFAGVRSQLARKQARNANPAARPSRRSILEAKDGLRPCAQSRLRASTFWLARPRYLELFQSKRRHGPGPAPNGGEDDVHSDRGDAQSRHAQVHPW